VLVATAAGADEESERQPIAVGVWDVAVETDTTGGGLCLSFPGPRSPAANETL
jgi:hypothetical protein